MKTTNIPSGSPLFQFPLSRDAMTLIFIREGKLRAVSVIRRANSLLKNTKRDKCPKIRQTTSVETTQG